MRVSIYLLVAVAICSPLHAAAQVAAAPGDRIRMQSPDGAVLVGVISSISSESIVVRQEADGKELAIPLGGAGRLERSLGRQRRFGRNFGVTLGVSSAAIGLVSALSWSPCRETGLFACFLHPESRGEAFGYGFLGGALIGLPLGVIVGLAAKSERWEPLLVPGTGGARISFAPIIGARLGVTGSISFGGP